MTDRQSNTDSQREEYIKQIKLFLGQECLPGDVIQSWHINERSEGNHVVKSASVRVHPPENSRWDYHAETVFEGPQKLIHRGVCVKSESNPEGGMEFSLEDLVWEFERAMIGPIGMFGMPDLEKAYWLPLISGLVRGVEMPSLTLNKDLRPFSYAVPIDGLSAEQDLKSFFIEDFGVMSGDDDNLFAPILASFDFAASEPALQANVPKAWGVVLARDFLAAEGLALRRARFTADLINFALNTGISHFDTRYDNELLEWDAEVGRSVVSLHPWIVILEPMGEHPPKGWVRPTPLVEHKVDTDLENGYKRISLFAEKFRDASHLGDIQEQSGRRALSDRETKLSAGIQRSLRWLGIASSEENKNDQFIATWISLEAILNCIDYPGVFAGNRRATRNIIRKIIGEMDLPNSEIEPLTVSKDLIRNRVFNNHWPLRTQLAMFAKSFGIELRQGDSELVRDFAKIRNDVFHAGNIESSISKQQLRRLRYLVERLVAAASVYGYEDFESDTPQEIQFGEIGPEGGAAPVFLDGREVSYRLVGDNNPERPLFELTIEGKIYSDRNANISFQQE